MATASDNTKKKRNSKGDEFIFLASHQLRSPVTRIRWMIEFLLRTEDLPKRVKNHLTIIQNSAVRLNDIITILLNVSRAERGKMIFSPRSFDLVKLIKRFLKEYVSFFNEKNITVIFKDHPPTLPVVIDDAAFYNIIQPLILNAIEYTLPGGKIEISLKKGKEIFSFIIKDSGIGIPQKDQKRIFEKFGRASNAQRTNKNGLGLGLYIANQIVKLLKGKIWFDSKENKGTTFYVDLSLINRNL